MEKKYLHYITEKRLISIKKEKGLAEDETAG